MNDTSELLTTHVAEQAGHSVATLARHYAGALKELEHAPRVPAGEAIRQAGRKWRLRQSCDGRIWAYRVAGL